MSSSIIRDLCKAGTANVAYCCIAAVLRGEPARQEQLIGRGPEHSIDKIHFIFNSIQTNSIAVHICMTFATVMQLSEAVLGACTCPSQLPCRTLMVLPTLSSKNHERSARGNSLGTVIHIQFNSVKLDSSTHLHDICHSHAAQRSCSWCLHMSESTPLQNTDGAADIVVQEP